MSDDEIESNKMRNALCAIAKEMQKLHSESVSCSSNVDINKCEHEEILHKLIKCKTSLNLRKIQIKKLRQNLRTACAVAKTTSSAKATETASLTNHLDFARNRYLSLVQQQNEKNVLLNNLRRDNHALRDQLEFYNNVIELGYKELQKIRNERVEDISTLEQLKQIIVCCGQYYADHCNEHEKCTRLEQKNRFLSNKILIMENNLDAASHELRTLRTCVKPYRDKGDSDTLTRSSRSRQCFGVVCSEYKIGSRQRNFTNLTMTKIELNNHSSSSDGDLDLTGHLKTVKKLLDDQDNLIRDLKSLSKVINIDESYICGFFHEF